MSGRARRPRQADIARVAQVSQATVSMVINNRGGKYHQIGEETRRRVWAAVEDLGYVVNPAARTLAGGRNSVVGVYTFESVFPVDHRDFYYPFFVGIEAEAERQDLDLLLFSSATGPDRNRTVYRSGVNRLRMADGCVLLGRNADAAELARLAREAFPFVVIGRRVVEGVELSYVGADYEEATGTIVGHLAELGHRRVALLGWAEEREPTLDRRRGYHLGVATCGLDVEPGLVRQVADDDVGPDLLAELLELGATAVIAEDDVIAVRIEAAARDRQLRVPDDLSVVILGNPPRGQVSDRDWTSFSIPRQEMGSAAVRMLVTQLDSGDDPPAEQLLLRCELHPGVTTAPPAT